MRPELDHRFCGRCGEPCGAYEEDAAGIDPPRICGRCAAERHRGSRNWARMLVIASGISLVALGQVVVEGLWLSRLWFPSAPRLGAPARWLYLVTLLALLAALIQALRIARQEAEHLREIEGSTPDRPAAIGERTGAIPAPRSLWTGRLLGLAAAITLALFLVVSLEAPVAYRLATLPRDWANAVHFAVLQFSTGMAGTVLILAWRMARRGNAC
ncbi:MAG: hypothetical protein HYY93_10690 [Planctomycetes bacterium]|nr:hypothetical protein [Planctomycetota bacterium]